MNRRPLPRSLRYRPLPAVPTPYYLPLRRHIADVHPDLYLGLRNDVLDERHAAVCDWTPDTKKPGEPME